MEPGPPADEEPPKEPNTEGFLAALLVDDAQLVVDSVTGKASVSRRQAGEGVPVDGAERQKDLP